MQNQECWYKDVCEQDCSGCIRFLEMSYLISNSGIPTYLQNPPELKVGERDYEAYCQLQAIKDNIVEFVENGKNLLICSANTGNGKTTWSIKIMLKYFNEIWAGNGFRVRAKFVHVPTLLGRLKNFNNPMPDFERERLMDCDLVVWDDIASTGLSQYDYSQLLTLIDNRVLARKSNIFTSNAVYDEDFDSSLGVKLTSRVLNTSTKIVFYGKDRRQ